MKRDPRLQRLSREHTQALLLAQRLRREIPAATEEQTAALYSQLIAFWSAGLLPHFRAEGECLLARLVRHLPHDDARVERLHRDHLTLEALVATMRDARQRGEPLTLSLSKGLLEFAEVIRTHVRWEEETLFPTTEELLTTTELDALATDLEARLPEHPLPWWEAGEE
jgi:hemerythrin-like domain-containing protein